MERGRVYNNFVTSEKLELCNKENIAIMKDYIMDCKSRGLSTQTIFQYEHDMRVILCVILEQFDNKPLTSMNKKDFRRLFLYFSEDCEMSTARVNRLHSCINKALEMVEDDDEYEDYDRAQSKRIQGLKKVKVRDNEDNFFFTYEESRKIIEKFLEDKDLMGACLFSLMFDSGARKNEVYQVTKDKILEGNFTNTVVGKRGKKFRLVYLDSTKELIRQYLEDRGEDDIESLWVHGHGDDKCAYSDNSFIYNRILRASKYLSEIRGEEVSIFPHSIRHSRLECLTTGTDDRLKNPDGTNRKYSIEEAKVLAHHEDLSTTSSYLKNKDDEILNGMFGF